jgi:NAD-dependent SIR2 family protein deacetylase
LCLAIIPGQLVVVAMLRQTPQRTSYSTSIKDFSAVACDVDTPGAGLGSAADAAAKQLGAVRLTTSRPKEQQPLLDSFDIQGVAELIKAGKAQKIVVMAGAGISVSAGIPDFRSPGTGLYSQLQRFKLPWPEAVFDIRYFRHDPKPFCMLAKELWPGYHKHAPTPAHHFIRLLHQNGLLHTVFTQNIDGLEQIAGLPAHKVVNAHGSFDGAHCIDCKQACSIYAVQAAVYDDEVPTCGSCGGLVKPDITFFGEPLPARFHRRRLNDLAEADLLIVMGTSLLVQPFAGMIDQVPASTPRVLVNLTRSGERKEQPQQQAQQPATPVQEDQGHGHPQQQQQQQQQGPCGPSCRLRRPYRHCKGDSSSSAEDRDLCFSSNDSSSSDGSDSDEDPTSPALTASSSVADMVSCCCSLVGSAAACAADAGVAAATAVAAPSAVGGNASAVSEGGAKQDGAVAGDGGSSSSNEAGFDFEGRVRDVLHLGDCDGAVQQLAALLGWQQELQQLVQAGEAALQEARACWED